MFSFSSQRRAIVANIIVVVVVVYFVVVFVVVVVFVRLLAVFTLMPSCPTWLCGKQLPLLVLARTRRAKSIIPLLCFAARQLRRWLPSFQTWNNIKKFYSEIYMYVSHSRSLSICLSVCLSVYMSACRTGFHVLSHAFVLCRLATSAAACFVFCLCA